MKSETRFCNCTTLGDSVKSIKSSLAGAVFRFAGAALPIRFRSTPLVPNPSHNPAPPQNKAKPACTPGCRPARRQLRFCHDAQIRGSPACAYFRRLGRRRRMFRRHERGGRIHYGLLHCGLPRADRAAAGAIVRDAGLRAERRGRAQRPSHDRRTLRACVGCGFRHAARITSNADPRGRSALRVAAIG